MQRSHSNPVKSSASCSTTSKNATTIVKQVILDQIRRDLRCSLENFRDKLDSDYDHGLNEDEVQTRKNYYGLNKLSKIDSGTEFGIRNFWRYFSHGFAFDNIALWLGGIFCIVLMVIDDNIDIIKIDKNDDLNIGLGLSVFCMLFGLLTYYMDAKCDYYIETARDQIKYTTNVIRESKIQSVPYELLVPGDVIIFNSGCRLFADVKIISCTNLEVNSKLINNRESIFYRSIYGTINERIFQSGDILFHSTIISRGFGKAIVINTNKTYLGNVPKENSIYKSKNAQTNKHLSHIVYITLFASLVISIAYAIIALFLNWNWISALILLVAVQVSITAESLNPTFLFAKAILVKRCVNKNSYIQNVDVLETIGMTNVICTNKTGILTDHQMIVSKFYIDNTVISSIDFLNQNINQNVKLKYSEPFLSFFKVCSVCNFAMFRQPISKNDSTLNELPFDRKTVGKPSEVALLCYTEALLESRTFIEHKYPVVAQSIYQTVNKCSFKLLDVSEQRKESIYESFILEDKQFMTNKPKRFWLCLKGIPEDIVQSCGKILTSNGLKRLTIHDKKSISDSIDQFGREGLRVLAIAQVFLSDTVEHIKNPLSDCYGQLEFLGLVAYQNPIRLSICNSVFSCRRAGIKVLMITSEHSETAFSIAQMSGIALFKRLENVQALPQHRSFTIKGQELGMLSCKGLYDIISSSNDIIFTRIDPNHKAKIVESCVSNESIVAVTGVGIPDIDILEKAQIKIGLGVYGADVVKELCDVILLDDEFTSIVHGIEAGRVFIDNLRKSFCFCLSSKFAQLVPFMLHAILGLPLMSSSITIVAIDLLTDNLPTLAIANEEGESRIMLEQPKKYSKNLICDLQAITISLFFYGVLQFLGCAFAYFVIMAESGFHFRDLIGIRSKWNSPSVNDLNDSFGQEWTYRQRIALEHQSNTVYFVNMILVRSAVTICCRTRYDSVFVGKGYFGCFQNSFVNFSIFFMFLFGTFFITYPWFADLFRVFPIKYHWTIISLPFAILSLILDEIRKYFIRKSFDNGSKLNEIIFY